MRSQDDIAGALAQALTLRIVRTAISRLQKLTCLASGEDSGLINCWDEICVQQQGEDSFFTEAYERTSDAILGSLVSELEAFEKLALWLETDEGIDWDCEEIGLRASTPPVFDGDIVEYLSSELYGKACDWSNWRIRRYQEASYVY